MRTETTAFEQKLATEDADIQQIVAGILAVQQWFARKQKRPLERGTHTKGVGLRGTFEVFDVSKTVTDAALASRLARGVFAKPGVYPATIRFANAASLIRPDTKPDVRAMSFAVDIPAGVLGPQAFRHDFSLNSATTFPLNDAHVFAAFISVQAGGHVWAKLRTFLALPWRDKLAVLRAARLGVEQVFAHTDGYQRTRFWSTVPFLHGPDEAVKYSATPGDENPGLPAVKGPDVLRNELARHLIEDSRMAYFDFGIQFLDVERMTYRGQRRAATFWIENAAVEWDETEAPFHTVARLTFEAGSQLTDAQCRAMYIDVTEHSLPESRPIGSINRARWAAESASRKARFAAAPAVVPSRADAPRQGMLASIRRRIGRITLATVVRSALAIGALVYLMVLAGIIVLANGRRLPVTPATVLFQDQGWGGAVDAADRQTYYYTAQGANLKDLRYSWFTNLELPIGRTRLADPDVMRSFGFIVDSASEKNPDRLPVGFSKYFDRELNEELLDISCAACHTGQLEYTQNGRTTAIRIDGGSAIHAFTESTPGHFVPTLLGSLTSTAANPLKFHRFANRVLGDEHTLSASLTLHAQMRSVIGNLLQMAAAERRHDLVPTPEGYGRTDALARISNEVFAYHIDPRNFEVGNAPVNYPAIWNMWKLDWVQYNASVSQPMARNIGESMGTGARYTLIDRYGAPIPSDQRYRSSAIVPNLNTIERTLRKLKPPPWPEKVFGPIDRERAQRGKELFNNHCVHCHGPFNAPAAMKARNAPLKTDAEPEWIVRVVCAADIGTDPNTAFNFAGATVDLTKAGIAASELRTLARKGLEVWKARQSVFLTQEIARLQNLTDAASRKQLAGYQQDLAGLDADIEEQVSAIDPQRLPVGLGLSYLGSMIRERAYAEMGLTPEQRAEFDGFGAIDRPQVVAGYKPRPLAGIWAAPPYLHNGSVATVYELLSPPGDRTPFRVGSREYDPVRLGLARINDERYPLFDPTLSGNSNRGHEFTGTDWVKGSPPKNGRIGRELTPDERLAIIEHLKVRNDDVDAPTDGYVPGWIECPPPAPRKR